MMYSKVMLVKIGIFCYKLHGVGPRNRTKNLVHGLGKYTDHGMSYRTLGCKYRYPIGRRKN